jgi:hypothetical protein
MACIDLCGDDDLGDDELSNEDMAMRECFGKNSNWLFS